MNMIINCLCNFLNFTQLELYIQRGNNKRANLENIKNKNIEENKTKIKMLSNRSNKNNIVINNNDFVNIEYNDGSTIVGKKMW
jgi:hypothetical protein